MKRNDLNKSMCEEWFGAKLEVTVEPNYSQSSDARRTKKLPVRDASDADETHLQDWGNGPKDGWMLQDEKKHVPAN